MEIWIVNGTDFGTLLVWTAFFLLAFGIQFVFCCKAKRKILRWIPAFPGLLGIAAALFLQAGSSDLGTAIFALFIAVCSGVLLIGNLAGAVFYYTIYYLRNKKSCWGRKI